MPRSELPAPLSRCSHAFEEWRKNRKHRRIPIGLWKRAVALAQGFGVCRTARVLRLDYIHLKKRVEDAESNKEQTQDGPPVFVEMQPSGPTSQGECVVEVEHTDGSKVRLQLRGSAVPDSAALQDVIWGARG